MSQTTAGALVDRLLFTCGGGRVLCVAPDPGDYVTAFRRRAVEAYAHPRRAGTGVAPVPSPDAAYDLILVDGALDGLDDVTLQRNIEELLRVTRGAVAVIARERSRVDMERVWLARGCRKHPLHQMLVPYDGLDWERSEVTLLFQPLPVRVTHGVTTADLAAGRDLHMDMLREPGRRADAHVARYMFAREFIRPGDRVIDAACGLGYGAAILADATLAESVLGLDSDAEAIAYATDHYGRQRPRLAFEARDVLHVASLPAGSVDAIVSFETIEHIAAPEAFLAACARALTPAGRFIGSVPNSWLNAQGVDPNPYHLHVFDRAKFEGLFARHFHLEQVYGQTAGGGLKLPEAGRTLWNARASSSDAEWWLAVGMKSPAREASGPVRHGLTTMPVDDRTNVLAFDRDYSNPWLVRAMITIGLRTQSDDVLSQFAADTLACAPDASADAGAALCVQAYRAIDRGTGLSGDLVTRIARYTADPSPVPHARRWQISLEFVRALGALLDGDLAAASRSLEAAASADVLAFSPLLATKTVGAAFLRGWIALQQQDLATARHWWSRGIDQAEAALHRPWDDLLLNRRAPAIFGLREAAAIVDLASQCATGLALAEHGAERPGIVAAQLFESLQERARRAAPSPAAQPAAPEAEAVPPYSWSLLNNLTGVSLRCGDPSQMAKWDLALDDTFTSALFLHPPGVADLTIPCGQAGHIRTAVAIHPDAWGQPGADICTFTVRVDDAVEATVRLDPHRRATDRRWVEIAIDVPASSTGSHAVTLETHAPNGVDFAWALFRGMTFVAQEAA